MDNTITIKTNSFKFNYIHLLIMIGFITSLFILTHVLTAKYAIGNSPTFKFEDAEGLMEEIYNGGVITDAVKNLPLDAELIKKMCEEIERQLAKSVDYQGCEVYYLEAIQNRDFPVLGYGDAITGFEYLRVGEVWKVGMTCNCDYL